MGTTHHTAIKTRSRVLQSFTVDGENNFTSHARNLTSAFTVEFLEMTSDRRLLLSWREPGRCN